MAHGIQKCKHGHIISQCRCIGPCETTIVNCPQTCTREENQETIANNTPTHIPLTISVTFEIVPATTPAHINTYTIVTKEEPQ